MGKGLVQKEENNMALSNVDIGAGGELQVAQAATAVMQEIQGAMFLAKKFPRNFDACWQRLMKACERRSFAEKARYSFPRSGKQISGESVHLARVAAQNYQNIRFGLKILRNDIDDMTIEGWAWDIENNLKAELQDSFGKLIFRKKGGWIKPDERDLRELVNRRGAILVRNCLFQILPRDYIEDAAAQCMKTLKSDIKDPEGEKKHLILDFGKISVTVEMINEYLDHDVWDENDIVELIGIFNAINEGAAKRDDYFSLKKPEAEKPANGLSEDKMKSGDASTHQGHGQELNLGGKDESKGKDKKGGKF